MYLTPWAAVALFLLAAVGALALVTSVGVWIFTSGLPEGSVDDVPAEPSNVRVIDRVDLTRGTVGTGGWPPQPEPESMTKWANARLGRNGTEDAS